MKKNDLISILITASVGFLVGFYLYLTSFAGILNKVFMFDAEGVSKLTVVGDLYGGCSSSCPSFQVTRDGSYHFIYPATKNSEKINKEGDLPFLLMVKLTNNLTVQELEKQSEELTVPICGSDAETNEVIYRITLDGRSYVLDSCETKVNKSSKLWNTLLETWKYLQTNDV